MKKEIELFMFDLDGTLANTGRDLANAVNYVRFSLDLAPLDHRLVYSHVGRGVEHLLRSSLPEHLAEQFKEVMDLFLQRYEKHLLDTTVLYPHVAETLDHFRHKKKAVVSNKLHRLTVLVLRGLGIEGSFDAIVGGDSISQKKPDPEPLRQTLRSFGIQPARAVMVGDGDTDIRAGKGAGVCTCGVTYGLGKKEELIEAKPDFLVDDLHQLTQYFC
jgi:phosphoglycolate phosphatase